VMDPALAGKWISPMHPEIVKDHPGKCDVCGMPLVRAEELGYVTASAGDAPLVIPASAPLVTGERAVVYVQVPDTERPTFEGREVVLGPRAGDHYLVRSGLAEGEEVVTNGNFKIDSALQIQAKPSMMSPDAGAPAPGHRHGDETVEPGATRDAAPSVPGSFRRSLGPVYEAYFALHDAVFAGDAEASASRFEAVKSALAGVETGDLGSDSRAVWGEIDWGIDAGAEAGLQAAGMEPLRVAFRDISEAMIDLEKRFGHPGHADHVRIFCPMAFDNQGASWLQDAQETRNPYYGAKMPRCGAVKETFPGTHDE
jgi:Cu(I)/Ag(I) efflux system membrane fusion protein